MRNATITLAFAIAMLSLAALAPAATVTLQAGANGQSSEIIQESMLAQNFGNNNYGGRADFEVGVAGNGQVRTAVMRFDVLDPSLGLYAAGIPQFSSIDSISLTLTMTGQTINESISDNMDVRIAAGNETNGDWGEGTADAAAQTGSVSYNKKVYNTLNWSPDTNYTRSAGNGALATITTWPGLNNAVTVNFTAPGINGLNSLTDLVASWATGNNEGILFNDINRSGFVRWFFSSSEASTVSARPMLTITYTVPTPAALPAGLGMMALAAMRRRRK